MRSWKILIKYMDGPIREEYVPAETVEEALDLATELFLANDFGSVEVIANDQGEEGDEAVERIDNLIAATDELLDVLDENTYIHILSDEEVSELLQAEAEAKAEDENSCSGYPPNKTVH